MLIISDTNILSSFCAGEALPLLFRLFPGKSIHIPPAVHQELLAGLAHGQKHLEALVKAITDGNVHILALSKKEQQFTKGLPTKLNAGEREAITLTQKHRGRLLSNDKQAVRYCRQKKVKVIDLPLLLRLLWTRNIVSPAEIRTLLEKMKAVENLQLSPNALNLVFAP